ncbi:MAG TPA: hypothetical protein DEQ17_03140 [Prevotella sp.]|nr:hypothetical protein [Prevotella sp.]
MKKTLLILNIIIFASLRLCAQQHLPSNPTFKRVFTYGKAIGTSIQDMEISGDTAISFSHAMEEVYLIDLNKKKKIGKLHIETDPKVHCNTVSFGSRYTPTDKWPLLYVAQYSNRHTSNVYRIIGKKLQLVQTITWAGYKNSLTVFDNADKSNIYVIAWNGSEDRNPRIFKIATPSIKESELTIDLSTKTDYFTFNYINKFEVVQGVTVKDGIMYQVRGYKNNGQLAVFDLKAKKQVRLFSLPPLGISAEPEGVAFQGDKLWICDQESNMFVMQ